MRSSALKVIQSFDAHPVPDVMYDRQLEIFVFLNLLTLFFYTFLQGWKWHNPACFWVGEESVTFNNARRVCASYNATLAIINNRYIKGQISAMAS